MSKQNKFTPGPWSSGVFVDETKFEIATADNRKRIAVVDMHSFEETKANARLIAAAPEIIAMLERIERMGAVEFSRTGMGSLRALIRKATGGQS